MASAKNLLLGKPVRSPLHPALVHLPIALFPLSLLLDVISWIRPDPDLHLVAASFYCICAGLITGLLAGLFGFIDFSEIRRDHPARKPATVHMILNLVALGAFALGAVLRANRLDLEQTPILPALISFIGVGLLSYSGYLGGHLVYAEGIAVGRHRHKPLFPDETLTVARGNAVMVPVADSSALPESGTLRVKVAGTAVTLARHGGKVYAVQEYCTHRYGPLSEGEIADCQVTCPWHNSRFDLRTGKVTHGPAKVDLKTFRCEEHDAQIWLESPAP
jgi:Ferredoxin subunits of nitrite reductase and ring-hydroxylating dioxygenases